MVPESIAAYATFAVEIGDDAMRLVCKLVAPDFDTNLDEPVIVRIRNAEDDSHVALSIPVMAKVKRSAGLGSGPG